MSQRSALEDFSLDQLEQMILELNRLKALRVREQEQNIIAEASSASNNAGGAETTAESCSEVDDLASEEDAPKPLGLHSEYQSDSAPVCFECKLPLFIDDSPREGERAVEIFGENCHIKCLTCCFCHQNELESYALLQNERKVVCKICAEKIFVCHVCNEPIVGTEFNKCDDGRYVHQSCIPSKLCGACEKMVRADDLHYCAADTWFHKDCFICWTCKATINGRFNRANGKLQCEGCLERMYKCVACKERISGRYLKLQNGDLLHPECAPKETCEACKGDITMNMDYLNVSGKNYHVACFRCIECNEQIEGSFGMKNDQFCCARCLAAK